MVLGFALLALEILTPGFFLLWIGLAALIVGALSLVLWDAGFLDLAGAGPRVPGACRWSPPLPARNSWGGRGANSDQPLLNRRGEQLIGRTRR